MKRLQELELRVARLEKQSSSAPGSVHWVRDPEGLNPYRSRENMETYKRRTWDELLARPFTGETKYKVFQKFPRSPMVKWTRDFDFGEELEAVFKKIKSRVSRNNTFHFSYNKKTGEVVIDMHDEMGHIFYIICQPEERKALISESLADSLESVFKFNIPARLIEENKRVSDYLPDFGFGDEPQLSRVAHDEEDLI